MSNTVISVEHLSKCYRLGAIGGGTLRADVSRWLAKLRGKADPNLKIGQEQHARLEGQEFWALRDVSFEVKQGEILGVIGRNGAGKSTLLKVLSRVTAPTSGQVKVKGRIASLLEVGTGFHPELTGRENIYLNGAILGMTKAEIRGKFDEIVDFSGVSDFIDTPVKRYSSGMYVRLAFAVAAHLEPEILIVDEVLAVGDAEFQKKCLGKMQDVAGHGRTILFVSHNMAAVTRLCRSGIVMEQGAIAMHGDISSVVARYLQSDAGDKTDFQPDPTKPPVGNDAVNLLRLTVRGPDGATGSAFGAETPLQVEVCYRILKPIRGMRIGFRLSSGDGTVVFTTTDRDADREEDTNGVRQAGVYSSCCHIPPAFLNRGQYFISLGSDIPMVQTNFFCENILSFTVEPVGGLAAWKYDNRAGLVCPDFRWEIHSRVDHFNQ